PAGGGRHRRADAAPLASFWGYLSPGHPVTLGDHPSSGFNSRMRILPVLDLQNGVVVRGLAGRRAEYRPVVSRLTTSHQPLDIAQAFRDIFGFEHLYLADLDAIAG